MAQPRVVMKFTIANSQRRLQPVLYVQPAPSKPPPVPKSSSRSRQISSWRNRVGAMAGTQVKGCGCGG